jgi:hypothetical protein
MSIRGGPKWSAWLEGHLRKRATWYKVHIRVHDIQGLAVADDAQSHLFKEPFTHI